MPGTTISGTPFAWPHETPTLDHDANAISDSELEVLKVLWEHGASTVRSINQWLESRGREWAYTTVQTLLQRLETKGFVFRDDSTHAHRFEAQISRDELIERHLGSLARRVCDGSASPLLLSLTNGVRLKSQEIAELRRMLDEMDEDVSTTTKKRNHPK